MKALVPSTLGVEELGIRGMAILMLFKAQRKLLRLNIEKKAPWSHKKWKLRVMMKMAMGLEWLSIEGRQDQNE